MTSVFQFPSQSDKPGYIQGIFQDIASRYDLMNDLMTFGLHRLWKRDAIARLHLVKGQPIHVLDVCCGTGDLSLTLQQQYPQAKVTGLDFCEPMLGVARQRGQQQGLPTIFLQGDALALPFEANQLDGVIIGYGLRNVAGYEACLRELYRVLKPGGWLSVLDMSYPNPVMDRLSQAHRFVVTPLLGALVGQNKQAYQYLTHSIFNYLTQQELASLMKKVGFEQVGFANKMGGVCANHWGQKG